MSKTISLSIVLVNAQHVFPLTERFPNLLKDSRILFVFQKSDSSFLSRANESVAIGIEGSNTHTFAFEAKSFPESCATYSLSLNVSLLIFSFFPIYFMKLKIKANREKKQVPAG